MSESFGTADAKKLVKDIFKDYLKKGFRFITDKLISDFIDFIKERYDKVVNYSGNDLNYLIKMAINYEEIYKEEYSLTDAIKFFKVDTGENRYLRCIHREQAETPQTTYIKLHHCFVDEKTKNVVLDGSLPYRVVTTSKLKDDLNNAFGNKDMFIIK